MAGGRRGAAETWCWRRSLGLGVALRSGKALSAEAMRAAFRGADDEELLCFLAIGRNGKPQPPRLKPGATIC